MLSNKDSVSAPTAARATPRKAYAWQGSGWPIAVITSVNWLESINGTLDIG